MRLTVPTQRNDAVRVMAEACAGWTDNAGDRHVCQFADEHADHKFDGKEYCRFHLPLGKLGEGGKADWDDIQLAAITDAIIGRIMAESKAEFEKPEGQRGELDFQGVVVPSVFRLNNQRISTLNMWGAQFHRDAHFIEAQFHGPAVFSEAQFHGYAWFNKAQFHGSAVFKKAQFHHARFIETQFHWFALFIEAQFHRSALFSGSANPAQLDARKFNHTSFYRAHFGAGATFSNREFRDHTIFSGCKFAEAPDFHGSILHQNTAFGGIECFPDATSDGAVRAYRTLRQAMEAHRARAEEGMFYTLEQKARRHRMSRFDPAFLISVCYGLGSNYGFSVVRPLAGLVGGIFASTLLLLCVGMVFGGPGGAGADLAAMWNDGLLFSVRQTFLPFDALRLKDEILAAYTFNPGGTGWLRAWGVVLTLFEALAALLLVLAVRWRYRR